MAVAATYCVNKVLKTSTYELTLDGVVLSTLAYADNRVTGPARGNAEMPDTDYMARLVEIRHWANVVQAECQPAYFPTNEFDYSLIKRKGGGGPQTVEVNATYGGLSPPGLTIRTRWTSGSKVCRMFPRPAMDLAWNDYAQLLAGAERLLQEIGVY